MTISGKFIAFAVCGIIIFSLSLIHQACGNEKQTKQQIAGYVAEINNLDTLLQGVAGAVLGCPKQGCNDYEEEAAKVLIGHLLTKKSGKWFSGFVAWQVAKKLISSGLDDYIQMAIPLGEVGIGKIVTEIKNKFEKSNGADVKVVGFGWKDIGVLPIYLPYKNRDGRYGNVDGEALMVFYSPHSISIKEIKEQVKSGGGRFTLYIPPIGLDEKLRQLPNEGIVRPFKLIIRGTVYELGEVKTYESWGETIKGPEVTFLDDKESVSPKLQITSSLRILESPPYKVGGIITAEFSIKNNGTVPVTFNVLTVGGRVNDICPNDKCPDFEWKKDITLKPNETYPYNGRLKLEAAGDYHFFTAYKTKDGQWNTAIPTAQDVTNTIDITVKPLTGKQDTEGRTKECRPPTGKIAFVREIGNTQGGRWIDSEIFVINADGSNEVRLTNNFVKDEDPDWSPDGRKIAFSSRRDGNSEIYVMNADGNGLMNLTKNPAHDAAPSWSPDGRKIAFQSDRDGSIQIYVMNADGSNQTRLTNIPPRNSYPHWSPNGSKIVFESFRDGNPEIYVMNSDGSNQTRLTYTGGNGGPHWSPDGCTIAFNFSRGGSYKIYVMNADGSNQRPLTNNPWWDYNPVWSSDGKWIAFVSLRDGHHEIYVMKADGSCQTRVTKNPALDYSPSFWTIRK